MSKGPLVTRAELRRRKEEQEKQAEIHYQQEKKDADKEFQKREKEISSFYRKEHKKQKEITKSRAGERTKIRERSSTLTKAIIIVALLLLIVIFIVLNL